MDLDELKKSQSAVATARQLVSVGVTRDAIAAQLRARRWQRDGRAIVLHNGPLTLVQTQWVAVLRCPQPAGLAGLTAARAAGVRLWFGDDTVHLLVGAHAHLPKRAGVKLHYSERLRFFQDGSAAPRVSTERAVVQSALWERRPKVAAGYFISACQQRKVQWSLLEAELVAAGDARHVVMLRTLLDEVRHGTGSLAESEFLSLARIAGLPRPVQQSRRVDGDGKPRFVDVDFGAFGVEIDGPVHWDAASYTEGLSRQNALVRRGEKLLRFSTATIWSDPDAVIEELQSAWVQWGTPHPHSAPQKRAS